MGTTIKLPSGLIEEARKLAALNMRSIPKQIEYCYKMGQLAEQNPDLPLSFIKEALAAKAEIEMGAVTPFVFEA